jgi:hypothetical protein
MLQHSQAGLVCLVFVPIVCVHKSQSKKAEYDLLPENL